MLLFLHAIARAICLIDPFWLGLNDGYNQPYDLTMGLSWDDNQDKNEAYDHGATLGQFLGRRVHA